MRLFFCFFSSFYRWSYGFSRNKQGFPVYHISKGDYRDVLGKKVFSGPKR